MGVGAETPCAAVSQAATSRQSHSACLLDELGELSPGLAPVMVFVGWAVERLLETGEPLVPVLA